MPQPGASAARICREYAARAAGGQVSHSDAGRLAVRLGYDPAVLEQLPEQANLGLSCGNPLAGAQLNSGEAVLDLGCGAGFDVFAAAREVGPQGRVLGIDMTPEMIDKANRNAVVHRRTTGLDNVEFREGAIESLPCDDSSFDVVVSNCVLNLVENQDLACSEILRVLRPGGRVAVSDLALSRALPTWLLRPLQPWIGCVARLGTGASLQRRLSGAGFVAIEIEARPGNVAAMAACQRGWRGRLLALPGVSRLAAIVVSVAICAEKPSHA